MIAAVRRYRLLPAILMLLVYLSGSLPGYVWHHHEAQEIQDRSSAHQLRQSTAHAGDCVVCLHTVAGDVAPSILFAALIFSFFPLVRPARLHFHFFSLVKSCAGRGPPVIV
ncbi:hypothetical protein JMG10_14815 [Nostoc ellipsosporum NOK]|nr:hypothetical protein [Nostoc ellipsosporum NOK]